MIRQTWAADAPLPQYVAERYPCRAVSAEVALARQDAAAAIAAWKHLAADAQGSDRGLKGTAQEDMQHALDQLKNVKSIKRE